MKVYVCIEKQFERKAKDKNLHRRKAQSETGCRSLEQLVESKGQTF